MDLIKFAAIFFASSFLQLIIKVESFNLDIRSPVIHYGPNGSLFGYSVQIFRENENRNWLIIGAPRTQTTQQGVQNGGAVFRCRLTSTESCQMIPFDTSSNGQIIIQNQQIQTEEKSDQWFGATVAVSRVNGIIIACAPAYQYFSYNQKRREPVGACYVSLGAFGSFLPLSPCRLDGKWGHFRLGYCEAGFSVAVSKDGRWIFLGAVGAIYWQGKLFSYNVSNFENFFEFKDVNDEKFDDNYLGYSMITGNFSGSSEVDVVAGIPRGNDLRGKVIIATKTMQFLNEINGDTMGSYFGYSVEAADLNGDGLDDIVIGAPMFSAESIPEKIFEQGKIYVAYQIRTGKFEIKTTIIGEMNRGRFGTALASLEDIDFDGFNDLAVGAPYAGDDGRGAVYIFNGRSTGISETYSQVIFGSKFAQNHPISTFGFSLSAGIDGDGNKYPDLLIGSANSDRTVFLRSRPVVHVNSTLQLMPNIINLRDKGCILEDSTKVTCIFIELCINFHGYRIFDRIASKELEFKINFDLDRKLRRVALLKYPDKSNVTFNEILHLKHTKCQKHYVYLKENIRDKLTPIEISITYDLNDNFHRNREQIKPILDRRSMKKIEKLITIQNNCSINSLCIPDLSVHIEKNVDYYLMGSDELIIFNITIDNHGEDAYEAIFELEIDSSVSYRHVHGFNCFPPKPEFSGKNLLLCELGNPFLANSTVNFSVQLKPKESPMISPNFFFMMNVSSSNPEQNTTIADNSAKIKISIRVEANLTLNGISEPMQIIHNVSETVIPTLASADDFGFPVTHQYNLINFGPGLIDVALVLISWPHKTLDGRNLLYPMSNVEIDIQRAKNHIETRVVCNEFGPDVIDPLLLPKNGHSKRHLRPIEKRHWIIDSSKRNMSKLTPKRRKGFIYFDPFEYRRDFNDHLETMACGSTDCIIFKCEIRNLSQSVSINFKINSRLTKKTISDLGVYDFVISSSMLTVISELGYGLPNTFIEPFYEKVSTSIRVTGIQETPEAHVWIIVFSALAGCVLFSLLVLALYKVGFFNRKRPPSTEDFEPLSPTSNQPKTNDNGKY